MDTGQPLGCTDVLKEFWGRCSPLSSLRPLLLKGIYQVQTTIDAASPAGEESDPGPAFGGLPLMEREPQRAREALCHQCVDLGLRDKPVLTQLSLRPQTRALPVSRWGVRLLGPLQSCGQLLPAGAGVGPELVRSQSGRQPGPQGGDFADTVT